MQKDKLLELLEDREIQEAIIKIVKQSQKDSNECIEKDREIEMLKKLVEKFKKCFRDEKIKTESLYQSQEQLTQDIAKIKREKDNKISKILSDKSKLNDIVEFYRSNFEEEIQAYELFQSLSKETKLSIGGIFKDDTIRGFISCGIQEKNISNFWEYIKRELIEEQNQDIQKLIEIFYFLFNRYSLAFPIYRLQDVKIGDSFDTELHIHHSSSSAVSGDIRKVLLKGWVNTKIDKVVKKSIVVVE